jgi:hypothetical protein
MIMDPVQAVRKIILIRFGAFVSTIALKWFGPEGGEPVDYEGGRDLDSLAKLYVPSLLVFSSLTTEDEFLFFLGSLFLGL